MQNETSMPPTRQNRREMFREGIRTFSAAVGTTAMIMLTLCGIHSVKFVWVKGHAGHPYNERCDEMAQARAREFRQ